MRRLAILLGFVAVAAAAAVAPAERQTEAQASCGYPTGFCIETSDFLTYYNLRGQHNTLGYPISRTFTLEGFQVQFFQRVILQLNQGQVARLNVLDPGVMPLTRANGSVFPGPDPSLAAAAPQVGSANYAQRIVEFVRSVSPESFNGMPVRFFTTFNNAVPAGDANPDIQTLLNLEIWGVPTSQPAPDPTNGGFVYQRFQRGIMHYRNECQCTEGILVGEYLKAVITGRNLPPDLQQDMQGSRFYGQYNPQAPNWVARPAELQATNMTAAFEPGTGTPPTPPGPPPPPPPATQPPGTPTPTVVGDALPTVTLQIDDDRIDPGQRVTVTIIARDDKGVDWVQFEGQPEDADDNDNQAVDPELDRRELDCDDLTECAKVFDIRPTTPGRYVLRARARDTAGQRSEWTTINFRINEGPTPTPTPPGATPTNTPGATPTNTPGATPTNTPTP